MYSLRNALTSVITKHGSDDDFCNPRDDEYIVSIGDGSNNIISDSNHQTRREQLSKLHPLYSNLSSEASEEISAPSILFQSTEESDTSSIRTSLSLSDLYHNPYDPMSFVKRSIQRQDSDTLAMIPAKSNYTASTNGESSKKGDLYLAGATPTSNNHSPTSVLQVPEAMIARLTAISTTSSGTSNTTANTTNVSFCSSYSDLPSPPPNSRTLLPSSYLPSPLMEEASSPRKMVGSPERDIVDIDLRDSPEPEMAGPAESPRRFPGKSIQKDQEEMPEISPIKQDRGSPWRIKSEPVEQQDLPEKSPNRLDRGSPWRVNKENKKEANSSAGISTNPASIPRIVTTTKSSTRELQPPPQVPLPPEHRNSASSQALASMARLQELEQKKHALRHQRFTLEQRLYQFCASKENAEAKSLEEQEVAKKESDAELPPKRLGNIIKRPWRSTRDQKQSKESTKEDKNGSSSNKQNTTTTIDRTATRKEGKMVVDWAYTAEIPATNELVSGENKKKQKKALQFLYTGRLNLLGQPHGDNATIKYSDGQIYRGSVRNGLRSGNGHNVWPDGQEYKGEWYQNSRNGRGTHSWKDGRTVTGDWMNGHLHGRIYFLWPNGASFDGSAKMGKKDGRGVHTWADGKVYNGHYFNGKENGFGTLTLPDGVKYRGQFLNGIKEGYGIMLWKTRTYDGEWVQDKPHGQGRVVWSNGAIYTGQFQAGKYHGLGVYVWPSGKKFVGRWENGVKNGHGLYTWPNGKKYDGEYKDGLKEGYGRMTWADGSSYCGGFKRNKRHGRGVQTNFAGVVVHCGLWKNDHPYNGEPEVPPTLELTDADRMLEDSSWPLHIPSKSDDVPAMISTTTSCSKVMVVTPDAADRHDISSPLSSAEEDHDDYDEDSSSGDVVLTPRDYVVHPQRSHEQVSICITDIE
ncbi:phosphatidylinositol-4-phosphate 5-kinase [Nitzschia inconspicua]|uniref:Phosphatidylinositol-4-phosphate 5-kinase n=1 Tax=Nitzschia inconspicua TaxID=303405 RepID=A0A9K3KYQ1_9STRA|nr:phosphatidylinositol-4-phosphate 5-kinase [Nitzschia inconspicua]